MKIKHTLLISLLLTVFHNLSYAEVITVDSGDIPANLKKTEQIKLTGSWNTDKFTELAMAIGTTGFGAANNTLTLVDMEEALIEENTSLYVNGGFSSNGVFINCKALQTVRMPAPEEAARFTDFTNAFMNCSLLQEINLEGCSGLTTLNNAFFGCSSLKKADLGQSTLLTKNSSMASSFDNCEALEEVVLPESILFAENTFRNCTALKAIDWTRFKGDAVPVLYHNMFSGITDLKAITLTVNNDMLALFEDSDWNQLTLATPQEDKTVIVDANDIPANLKKAEEIKLTGSWNTDKFTELAMAIGTTGFGAANNTLTLVDMEEALIEENTSLYVNGGFSSNGVFINCKALQTVRMPAPEEAARFTDFTNAFMNCSLLQEINLEGCSGLTTLNNAFFGCSSLKKADLGQSTLLTKNSSMASSFDNCEALEEVVLPESILFAENTFRNCTALKAIDWTRFKGDEVPVLYHNMFNGITDLKAITLTVSNDMLALFEDSDWNQLTLAPENPVGITPTNNCEIPTGPVYDLQGRYIRTVTHADELNNLPAGIYIVGGRKIYLDLP